MPRAAIDNPFIFSKNVIMKKKNYLHPSVCRICLRTEGLLAVSLGEGSADPNKPVLAPPFGDAEAEEEGFEDY